MIDIIPHDAPQGDDLGRLLTAPEVAELFRVGVRTIGAWARTGRLPSVRTPGGHRRYRESAVLALLVETDTQEASA